MVSTAKQEREARERPRDGFERPPGWSHLGLGRRNVTQGAGRGGSLGLDNAFRLGLGIILGTGIGIHLVAPSPEQVRFTGGNVNIPSLHGMVWGFLACIGPCFLVARARRVRRWLFTGGFVAALGAVLVLELITS